MCLGRTVQWHGHKKIVGWHKRYLLEILFASILKIIDTNIYDPILDSVNRNIVLDFKEIIIIFSFNYRYDFAQGIILIT